MSQVDVPVVGGHAGLTILPLFSQATPLKDLSAEERDALTKRTQDGGTEVVQAKAGKVGKQGPCSVGGQTEMLVVQAKAAYGRTGADCLGHWGCLKEVQANIGKVGSAWCGLPECSLSGGCLCMVGCLDDGDEGKLWVSRPRPDGRVLSWGTGEMWQLACLAVGWQSLGGGVRGSADQGGLLGFGLLRW